MMNKTSSLPLGSFRGGAGDREGKSKYNDVAFQRADGSAPQHKR